MNKIYRSIWNAATGTHVAVAETTKTKGRRCSSAVMAAGAVLALSGSPGTAQAALVSACTGVGLPPSVVTGIVGQAVLPITGALDPVLNILLHPLGLNTNLTNTLASIASGAPIQLNVLDVNGNLVDPITDTTCYTTADDYTLKTPKGISIGGNHITGLGATTVANAGELNSIAFGNGATTNATATSSIAIGPNASVGAAGINSVALGSAASATVANSVALGAGSTATTGGQSYTAFGLPGTQISNGEVSVGSTGLITRKITNVAPGSSAFDAVNVAQLTAVDNGAVKYDNPLINKMSVTLGGTTSTDGGVTNGTTISNLHQGQLSATSTDAVNGSQLYATNLRIDNILNTGVKYFHANSAAADSVATGAESVAIGPNSVSSGASSLAAGNGATTNAAAANSIAIGSAASIGAAGTNSVALGSASSATAANSVALGAGSTAATGAQTGYTAFGLAAPQTSAGEVSVGSAGSNRKITNVAAGSSAFDAVNVAQLTAVDNGAVKYDNPALKTTVTLGGPLSTDGGVTNGTTITNVHQGQVTATSTDAVNGAQLFAINQGNTVNMDALGQSVATNLGGGSTYNTTTHVVSPPTYNVYGAPQNNVGAAITALQTSAPLQYSDAAGVPIPNTTLPSLNDVTLVGPVAGPVTLHNVANGVAPNDAVNKSQLDAVQTNVTNLDALAVKYDDVTKAKATLGGAAGTTITNVAPGALNATSTDAVNGSQLYTTNVRIDNLTTGTTKYFHASSTKVDSLAVGTDSIAIGPAAVANGAGSVAMGDNSQTALAATGAVAIGQNSMSSGVNSIAIGTGAVATGSVAVGAGAQAGNGGAAFGDNANALAPQQGTAVGNGTAVTADRGVALGAGAQATRAGMNGTTEKYSNVAVTSNEGAVSVGSAGNERQITNVAGGTAATDAVNVRQLDAVVAQSNGGLNNRIDGLQNDILNTQRDANAGAAGAMSMASMPQAAFPGKSMVAAGMATYQGQSALSIGVSSLSDNGRWVFKLNGTANTRGNAGAGVGVGLHF